MTQRQPTVIFPTITALYTLCNAATWPTLLGANGENLNSDGTVVTFGSLTKIPSRETVAVTGSVEDNEQRVWPEKGLNTKHEAFSTELIVATVVPNRTEFEAWARLQVLVEFIDALLRDMTTGRPIIPQAIALLGVYTWSSTTTRTALYPSDNGKFHASAGVSITVEADH